MCNTAAKTAELAITISEMAHFPSSVRVCYIIAMVVVLVVVEVVALYRQRATADAAVGGTITIAASVARLSTISKMIEQSRRVVDDDDRVNKTLV